MRVPKTAEPFFPQSAIFKALDSKDNERILRVLRDGDSVFEQTAGGQTPLHIAVDREMESAVKMLLEKDQTLVELIDPNGSTPLHIAAAKTNTAIVRLLLFNNSSVFAVNNKGFMPLHIAASNKNVEIAKELLRRDAPVNAEDLKKRTPLHIAMAAQNKFVADLLVNEYEADLNAFDCEGKTPLAMAKQLFPKEADWLSQLENKRRTTAGQQSNISPKQSTKRLSPSPFDNGHEKKKIMKSSDGNRDVTRSILKKVPVLDDFQLALIIEAMLADDVETLNLYLGALGSNAEDLNGNTYLHLAVQHSSRKIVDFLLRLDSSSINKVNENGETPLDLAKTKIKPSLDDAIIKMLLENEQLAKIKTGQGALSFRNSMDLVDTEEVEEQKQTMMVVLFDLVKRGETGQFKGEVSQSLLMLDFTKKDDKGDTLLHIAVRSGNPNCVRDVLEVTGSSLIDEKNIGGKTPLDLAKDNTKITELLIQKLTESPSIDMWDRF